MLYLINCLIDRMIEREISNDVHSCHLFMICSFAALSSKNINISLVYSLIFSTYAFLHVWNRFIVFFFITLRLIFRRLRMREMIVIFTKTSNSSNKYFIIFFKYNHDFVFKKCFNATFIENVTDRERSNFLIERDVKMLNVFKLLRIFFIIRLITSFILAIDLRDLSTRKWWTMRLLCDLMSERDIFETTWCNCRFFQKRTILRHMRRLNKLIDQVWDHFEKWLLLTILEFKNEKRRWNKNWDVKILRLRTNFCKYEYKINDTFFERFFRTIDFRRVVRIFSKFRRIFSEFHRIIKKNFTNWKNSKRSFRDYIAKAEKSSFKNV